MRFSAQIKRGRTARTSAVLLAGAALALGACGDDEDPGTTPSADSTAEQPATGSGDVVSTNLDPDADATVPDLPQNDDPSAVQCTGPPQGVFDATAVVGDGLGAATQAAADQGCEVRVVVRDGRPLAVTEDYRPDRVNVVVRDGEVVRIASLG
jgi:hypothetical protein